jgi:uncharacterized RDD family membrane protein YckC
MQNAPIPPPELDVSGARPIHVSRVCGPPPVFEPAASRAPTENKLMTQESNPYLPPKTDITVPEGQRAIVPASKGRRFGTLLVDYAAFMALSACIGVIVALKFGEEGLDALQKVPDFAFGMGVLSVYYIFFEGIWARTPGKLVFGTVVITESGGKPSIVQVIGRTLCRFIPFEAFSCLSDRGWHDSIPKTRVVMARSR